MSNSSFSLSRFSLIVSSAGFSSISLGHLRVFVQTPKLTIELTSSIESVVEIIFAKVLIVTFDLTSLIINLKLQNNREKI